MVVQVEVPPLDGVVARLRELDGRLPPGDGVAVFNRMYLTVTEEIRDRLAGPCFGDPAAVAELDVVFAGRYLTAVDADLAGQRPTPCWRPLFSLRAHPHIHPVQFALAGMNAHIELDLPLAVVETCRRRSCPPEALAADYHRINEVLAALEARVREQLLPGPDPLDAADPLVHLAGSWSIERARDAAWASVLALWGLRRLRPAYRALAAALDDSVGMVGRYLLTPVGGRPSH
ncbi:DUF5995 family protein [Peterkaempfera bronchialis]|uniref:Uncharacterized protein n=1 Tax=Peterkaempfera bronchialis TaxID=2126346 RepID=A0A345T449_9ACTN|nr:DUF5995 family protein [Peterkaempfera bronchialis]AXI80754.1 hypothetical protein C7M71_028605 [Peterkaempfera bronchialis]